MTPAVTSRAEGAAADTDASAGDWPQLFGAFGNSWSREVGLKWNWKAAGPPVLWRVPVGTGYSAPVVHDGQVFLQQRQGEEEWLECRDGVSGAVLWTFKTATDYECQYPYSNGPYATPSIGADKVYLVTAAGGLLALNRADGQLSWRRDLLRDFDAPVGAFGFGNSPKVCGDRIVLNVGGSRGQGIAAFAVSDGATLWVAGDAGRSYATAVPAVQHERQRLYVLTEQGLVSLSLSDGTILWDYPFGVQQTPERVNAVTPLVIGNRVALMSGPGPGAVVLDIEPDGTFRELWRNRRALDGQYTNLLHVDGCLYGVTSRAAALFCCVDLRTGERLWEFESDLCRANSLYADGHLLVCGEHGHLACFRPGRSSPDLVWMTEEPVLASPCFSAPALSRGLLYLRNERELVCLDLR